MEFQVLGPLEVVEDGRSLRLGSRKQRALLALLLLRAGEVVARDWLIEELWHGQPPAAAEASVHAYVSRLRSGLGANRLQTRSPGYALVLVPEELDSNRFERLVVEGRAVLAQARPGEAARRLGEGLALWRGDAFADFVYEPFAQAEIARLAELRLEALEERAEAGLQLGDYEALIAELKALVAAHPLRERLCRQLMCEEHRLRALLSSFAPMLGRWLCALHRYSEAEYFARLGRELGDAQDVWTQMLWRQAQALVLASQGEHALADVLVHEAVALSEQTDALNAQGDALCDVAEVLQSADRGEEASAVLEQALEHYERKQNIPMATRVRNRLTGLGTRYSSTVT